ncbi:hypothetical protein BJ508DRAFT_33796 [Ascobolus immersus RN42]|uniref:Uncharacterized protein n=1 Tax=Ascobolus immersus RN42 TaxID=1160509 RepID=A0A3N4HY41_ASCIM|nr:hypothetical protein BJ508DRAFT_33796 [Ascobolus immersus RN42]
MLDLQHGIDRDRSSRPSQTDCRLHVVTCSALNGPCRITTCNRVQDLRAVGVRHCGRELRANITTPATDLDCCQLLLTSKISGKACTFGASSRVEEKIVEGLALGLGGLVALGGLEALGELALGGPALGGPAFGGLALGGLALSEGWLGGKTGSRRNGSRARRTGCRRNGSRSRRNGSRERKTGYQRNGSRERRI